MDIVLKKSTLANDLFNYHGQNICDKSGECDSERFDCWSDCSDGSNKLLASVLEMIAH